MRACRRDIVIARLTYAAEKIGNDRGAGDRWAKPATIGLDPPEVLGRRPHLPA